MSVMMVTVETAVEEVGLSVSLVLHLFTNNYLIPTEKTRLIL